MGAAWTLRLSGFEVDVFEARDVGGNAKTQTWPDGRTTGLSVLAWPPVLFRNYRALLRTLGVSSSPVVLPFFVRRADGESFAHGASAADDVASQPLRRRYAVDFRRWARMVRGVRRVNAFFARSETPSLYHLSLLNPLNLIPLRTLARACGVSRGFWREVFVPLYAPTRT